MEALETGGDHDTTTESFAFEKVQVVAPSEHSDLLQKSAARRNLVNFRTVKILNTYISEKVGLFESQSRLGRTAQAIGTYLLPGDTTSLRKPVRSAIYQGLTPGGGGGGGGGLGGGLGRAAARQALRCPVGFEFGGRYATRGFGNCGRQLFEAPGPIDDIGNGRIGRRAPEFGLIGLIDAEGRRVTGIGGNSRAVQIQRAAQIPRVGAAKNKERDSAVERLTSTVGAADGASSFMVRRDGFALKPAVSADILRRVRNNPDMVDSTFIVNASDPAKMAEAEIPLIWAVGAQSVRVALPDNNYLELSRAGKLSSGDKRKLTRRWATIGQQDEFDYGSKLRSIAELSDGALIYKEKFGQDKSNELVQIVGENGARRSVRRWVFKTFLSEDAPRRGGNKPWKEVDSTTDSSATDGKVDSVDAAADRLRAGGTIDEVPSEYLDDAIRRSKAFKVTKLRDGVERLDRPDGLSYYRLKAKTETDAVSARAGADIRNALGLAPSTVKFGGTPDKRSIVYSGPENIDGAKINRADSLSNLGPEQLMRLAVADWLTDQVDRSPGKITPVSSSGKPLAFVTPDFSGAGAGLSKEELDARRRAVLGDFFTPNNIYAQAMSQISPAKKRNVVALLESILKQAEQFKWNDYQTRLKLDGRLSDSEKAHLNILSAIYKARLAALRQSRKMFLRIIGLG